MDNDTLRLAFVGDVCLASLNTSRLGGYEFPGWPAIKDAIGRHDFLIGNLECCLVDSRCSEEVRQRPMAVPAEAISSLRDIGFSDISLANNHMLDCGPEAIEVTREYLSSHGIRSFGAGADLSKAEQAVFANHNGHRIAYLGACDNSEYYAGNKGQPGIAPLKKSRLGRRVRAAAVEADLVVVTLHADLEFSDVPGPWRKRLSRWLIRQGAHLVIQHHPHVLQGVETYRNGVIAYSLGNFIFKLRGNQYQEQRPGVFDSIVLVVDADLSSAEPKLVHHVIPIRIDNNHLPRRVTGTPHEKAIQQLDALSSLIADQAKSRRAWFRRCQAEARRHFFSFYYALRRGEFRRGNREFWQPLIRHEDRRWLLGLISFGYL